MVSGVFWGFFSSSAFFFFIFLGGAKEGGEQGWIHEWVDGWDRRRFFLLLLGLWVVGSEIFFVTRSPISLETLTDLPKIPMSRKRGDISI
jgi:hypothetical protein